MAVMNRKIVIRSIFILTALMIFCKAATALDELGYIRWSASLNPDKTSQSFAENPAVWSKVVTQSGTSYRLLKPKSAAKLFFRKFGTDSVGLCKQDMILEILYRDDIRPERIGKYQMRGRVAVQARIDFRRPDEYVAVGYLDCRGDGKWKTTRVFIERTPRNPSAKSR